MTGALRKLNAVPGVIGTMLCDREGAIVADAFPPAFDRARLLKVASVLVGRTAVLEGALGASGTLDLRFGTARVVVHAGEGQRLVFLCHPAVNPSLLALAAADLLRRPPRAARQAPAPQAPPPGGALYALLQRIDEHLAGAGASRFKLRGRIAVKAGLALELVAPDDPDDPEQLARLRAAATEVLGHPF
jgi:predicted regulator of Ras-like GTPase activity (Roadblock/LC7/MglB family)